MLIKRGEIWHIKATVNGQRVRRSTGTADKKAAQELHDALIASAWRVSHLGEKPARSLDEAAQRWLEEKSDRKALRDYRIHLDFWVERAAGLELTEITRDWVHAQISNLKSRKGTPAAGATKSKYVGTLRAVLNVACKEWEWIDHVPAFRTYGVGRKVTNVLSPPEVRALLDVLPDALKPAIGFAVLTGLRKSNVFGLEWSKVDLERRVAWVVAEDAKAGKQIVVPLSAPAVELLAALPREGRRVFAAQAPCTHQWRRYVARAGLDPKVRFHDLRHTWASWHAMAGTDIKTLQALGGWSTPAMLERYVHLLPDHLAAAQERLGNALAG